MKTKNRFLNIILFLVVSHSWFLFAQDNEGESAPLMMLREGSDEQKKERANSSNEQEQKRRASSSSDRNGVSTSDNKKTTMPTQEQLREEIENNIIQTALLNVAVRTAPAQTTPQEETVEEKVKKIKEETEITARIQTFTQLASQASERGSFESLLVKDYLDKSSDAYQEGIRYLEQALELINSNQWERIEFLKNGVDEFEKAANGFQECANGIKNRNNSVTSYWGGMANLHLAKARGNCCLEKALKADADRKKGIAIKYRNLAEKYTKASVLFNKVVLLAPLIDTPEFWEAMTEGNVWSKVGCNALLAAEEQQRAIEIELNKGREIAGKYYKIVEAYERAVHLSDQAAQRCAAKKTADDEVSSWSSAAYCAEQSAEELRQAFDAEEKGNQALSKKLCERIRKYDGFSDHFKFAAQAYAQGHAQAGIEYSGTATIGMNQLHAEKSSLRLFFLLPIKHHRDADANRK